MRVFCWKQPIPPICHLVNFVSVFVGIHEYGTSTRFGHDVALVDTCLPHSLQSISDILPSLQSPSQLFSRTFSTNITVNTSVTR